MVEHRRVQRLGEGAAILRLVAPCDHCFKAGEPGQRQPHDRPRPHGEARLRAKAEQRQVIDLDLEARLVV